MDLEPIHAVEGTDFGCLSLEAQMEVLQSSVHDFPVRCQSLKFLTGLQKAAGPLGRPFLPSPRWLPAPVRRIPPAGSPAPVPLLAAASFAMAVNRART